MEKINSTIIMQQRLAECMGFDKYTLIQEQVHKVDVSKDTNFQRMFNRFYRVRRNEGWRKQYYQLFEQIKQSNKLEFAYILEELYHLTGNIEASFSSKMLATLKPEMPIWDKYVIQNLQIKIPKDSDAKRILKVEKSYSDIVEWYRKFMKTENAQECLEKFDEMLPDYAWFSEVKKIDFYLWSIR